jgi:hypothetical protein
MVVGAVSPTLLVLSFWACPAEHHGFSPLILRISLRIHHIETHYATL